MELRDALGTLHAPAGADARIVSLVPSITELVCDLGLSDRLVGRTGFCVHPRDIVRSIPKVGGTKDVDLEKIRALEPTHVILNIDENEKPLAEALARFVPHLVVTHPLAPDDNLALYRLLGGIFGKSLEAEVLCGRFAAARAAVAAAQWPERNVVYLIWKDPWMTVARDTYISRTLALFGLRTLPRAFASALSGVHAGRGIRAPRPSWCCSRQSPTCSGRNTSRNSHGAQSSPASRCC